MWWTNTYCISSDLWGSAPTNFKRLTATTMQLSLCLDMSLPSRSHPPSLPTPSPFSCSLKHSTGFSQQWKREHVWFTTSFCLHLYFTFRLHISYWKPGWVGEDVWTIYFPLNLSSLWRSTNHHSRCQEFYQDLEAGLEGAQQHMVLTLDLGSGGHFIFGGAKRAGREWGGHTPAGMVVLSSHLLR